MSKVKEKNEVRMDDGLVYISLLGKYEGREAITDLKSYLKCELFNYTWRSSEGGYVYTYVDSQVIYMHRLITNNTSKLYTDHIKNTDDPVKDKLDNRACNLRIATNRQNQYNSRLKVDNKTGYKGVHLNKDLYAVHTKVNGRKYYVGGFNIKKYKKALEMAAYCYDVASEWIHGEFACHNNIKECNLLTDAEMKIVEEITYKNIEKHKLSIYEKIKSVEPTNIFEIKYETASTPIDAIS
jgi:hypothetical protein